MRRDWPLVARAGQHGDARRSKPQINLRTHPTHPLNFKQAFFILSCTRQQHRHIWTHTHSPVRTPPSHTHASLSLTCTPLSHTRTPPSHTPQSNTHLPHTRTPLTNTHTSLAGPGERRGDLCAPLVLGARRETLRLFTRYPRCRRDHVRSQQGASATRSSGE